MPRGHPPRIEIYDLDGNYGPDSLRVIIDSAKWIGVSSYANEVGECYFTLPYRSHFLPAGTLLERHYRISRYDTLTGTYQTVGRGVLEDFEHSGDEVVYYGSDYMGLLETTITPNDTTYSNQFIGTIITDQLTAAQAETNSRLAFTGNGTIDTTTVTTTLLTSSEPRLNLIRSSVSIAMATSSVRSIFGLSRDAPYNWYFTQNKGSEDLRTLRLEYGGAVNGFFYVPGMRSFATRVRSIGLKVEGATVLYGDQSHASATDTGEITRFELFRNVVNQQTLDDLTKRAAREWGVPEKSVRVVLRANQLHPWDGWDLGDNIRVAIRRSPALTHLVNDLYTIWGMEWTTEPNGRENLHLALASKMTS
jgi:hypothetical protein